MYAAIDDPYCYPGTTVLKNKLGLREQRDLDAFETEISFQRSTEAMPPGRLSYTHYRAIHRHLFQDVYTWAGKVRNVRISKGGSTFCYPEHIDQEMSKLFKALARAKHFKGSNPQAFAKQAAHFLAELNAIHPFREGNGRVQLTFLTLLAEKAGHPLVLRRLDPERIMKAVIASFGGNEAALTAVIQGLLEEQGRGSAR
ncbi:Fic/DOC family protein [Bradyrhizobium glycinis]|uniref:Fic/DOC family protein n=1 Tax=Bradyrhizobium glycinis TaxID=2751812 RepID=UPI0018D78917|nr:Fic family protein [Bradyrhizobium glycinis]MBH5372249.1 Fic family protein [Bradyrhizobium glycinis]